MTATAPEPVEDLLRDLRPRVLGLLVRRCGDLADAEDALQEALLAAATRWPADGLPDDPRAWLVRVAERRLVDTVRADVARRRREETTARRDPDSAGLAPAGLGGEASSAARSAAPGGGPGAAGRAIDVDDSLTLFFLCCHPDLPPASAVALTLRTVGGLTTAEIARAFGVPEATMTQRLTRARRRLAALDRPFATPGPGEWDARLAAVLRVLYVVFTEGHTATSGPLLRRADLSGEAIRLARTVHALLPDDPEVGGLLALMLLTDARRDARTGPRGELVPLADQDRTRWDHAEIVEGVRIVTATLRHGLVGSYQVQAAVAALHAQAPSTDATDWERVLALYSVLERLDPSPHVTLNRAVAVAMVDGPRAGLALLDGLDGALATSHRLPAVRAHLLERAGETRAAVGQYVAAAAATPSPAERDYLTLRAARLRTLP
ncbi:RNA polymerase sigma factor [Cellulosimicrobium cellulans]|uniref:RNA polymerase sigma factor n=1 Tax=Cellulosimicrobium cellulans TaxID=1710 RepID=UPI002098294C|nr:sigma-70 family RNA polymerase sigma factor [Cellulosimicrobium cellulans]MCO7273762.1 sigma-70 family RNA polymerase sigma factor [Cellulosimicrobium cellulans]